MKINCSIDSRGFVTQLDSSALDLFQCQQQIKHWRRLNRNPHTYNLIYVDDPFQTLEFVDYLIGQGDRQIWIPQKTLYTKQGRTVVADLDCRLWTTNQYGWTLNLAITPKIVTDPTRRPDPLELDLSTYRRQRIQAALYALLIDPPNPHTRRRRPRSR